VTSAAESVNRDVWSSEKVLGVLAAREGFIDAGEQVLLERVTEETAERPLLDVGVGAGRTIPLLAAHGGGYVAVDYLPEMVALARELHPGVRVDQADARDFAGLASDSFGAVFFSFNGIDGIAHEDRDAVHRAALRVLAPGGLYLLSTHNLEHETAGLPPWHPRSLDLGNGPRAMLACAYRMPRRGRSWRRLAPLRRQGEGWAVLVGSGYDFSVLWHHVTPAEAAAEVRRAGFENTVGVFASHGGPLADADDSSDSPWLYVLARKPPAHPG
jgi:SAM-dependent methyltransferase